MLNEAKIEVNGILKSVHSIATKTGTAMASAFVSVRDDYKNADGEYQWQQVPFTAFGKKAELLLKLPKGKEIGVRAEIRSRATSDDQRIIQNDLVVKDIILGADSASRTIFLNDVVVHGKLAWKEQKESKGKTYHSAIITIYAGKDSSGNGVYHSIPISFWGKQQQWFSELEKGQEVRLQGSVKAEYVKGTPVHLWFSALRFQRGSVKEQLGAEVAYAGDTNTAEEVPDNENAPSAYDGYMDMLSDQDGDYVLPFDL